MAMIRNPIIIRNQLAVAQVRNHPYIGVPATDSYPIVTVGGPDEEAGQHDNFLPWELTAVELGRSESEVQQWARTYRERGFAVVRLQGDSKLPICKDWNLQSAEPDEFEPNDSIGIQTGTLSSCLVNAAGEIVQRGYTPGEQEQSDSGLRRAYLVCVDLDSKEAIELADKYLPTTKMIDGRCEKLRSHRLYLVTDIPLWLAANPNVPSGALLGGPKNLQYNARQSPGVKGKGACVIDVLGTGKQAVAPPSLHVKIKNAQPVGAGGFLGSAGSDGETGSEFVVIDSRQWDTFGDPAVVDCQTLYRAIDDLAVACGCDSQLTSAKPKNASRPGTASPAAVGPCEPRYHPDLPPMAERVERARAYLAKVPEAVSGEGGHNQTFHVACLLVWDFALDREHASELLLEYNERCDPEWSEEELEHKLDDADRLDGLRGEKLLPQLVEAPDDPHRLARLFLEQRPEVDGRHCYVYRCEEWYHWDGTCYVNMPRDEFEAYLNRFIRSEFERVHRSECRRLESACQEAVAAWTANSAKLPARRPAKPSVLKVTSQLVSNTLAALRSMVVLPAKVDLPSWLISERAGECRNYVAVQNGLLDIDAYLAGTPAMLAHTPRWFSTSCLPFAWDPTAQCPRWLKALGLTFNHDLERIGLLQEWFGYCLSYRTDLCKFLILIGEGGNGKSLICAALTALLGRSNVSTVGLEAFNERFGLKPTLGKLANIAPDMGELDKVAEGKLKAFVSSDGMTIDRKNREPVEVNASARLVFATNTMPRFSDKTDGVWRRAIILPCDVTIPEHERVLGMNDADWWERSGELAGMLAWALEGRRRLEPKKGFSACRASADAVARARVDCNPARDFLLKHYGAAAGAEEKTAAVYLQYQTWCEQNGHKHPLANNKFGEEVRRVFPDVKSRQLGPKYGRAMVYAGIKAMAYAGGEAIAD